MAKVNGKPSKHQHDRQCVETVVEQTSSRRIVSWKCSDGVTRGLIAIDRPGKR